VSFTWKLIGLLVIAALSVGAGNQLERNPELKAAVQRQVTDEQTIAQLRRVVRRVTVQRNRARKHLRREYVGRRRERRSFRYALHTSAVGSHPLETAFLCIHSHEGSWTDAGDPYWGGLQMDRQFMSSYGGEFTQMFGGFANRWPVSVQITVALRAFRTRGFGPWPATRRMCGL